MHVFFAVVVAAAIGRGHAPVTLHFPCTPSLPISVMPSTSPCGACLSQGCGVGVGEYAVLGLCRVWQQSSSRCLPVLTLLPPQPHLTFGGAHTSRACAGMSCRNGVGVEGGWGACSLVAARDGVAAQGCGAAHSNGCPSPPPPPPHHHRHARVFAHPAAAPPPSLPFRSGPCNT